MNKFSTYFTSFKSRKTELESLFFIPGFLFSFLEWDVENTDEYFPQGLDLAYLQTGISGVGLESWVFPKDRKQYLATDRIP